MTSSGRALPSWGVEMIGFTVGNQYQLLTKPNEADALFAASTLHPQAQARLLVFKKVKSGLNSPPAAHLAGAGGAHDLQQLLQPRGGACTAHDHCRQTQFKKRKKRKKKRERKKEKEKKKICKQALLQRRRGRSAPRVWAGLQAWQGVHGGPAEQKPRKNESVTEFYAMTGYDIFSLLIEAKALLLQMLFR